jgi:hypothetical protein
MQVCGLGRTEKLREIVTNFMVLEFDLFYLVRCNNELSLNLK